MPLKQLPLARAGQAAVTRSGAGQPWSAEIFAKDEFRADAGIHAAILRPQHEAAGRVPVNLDVVVITIQLLGARTEVIVQRTLRGSCHIRQRRQALDPVAHGIDAVGRYAIARKWLPSTAVRIT